MIVGVLRETAAGERRVALTPDGVARLVRTGADVLVERGAGLPARFPDETYAEAGATVSEREDVHAGSEVIVCVRAPGDIDRLGRGRTVAGLLGLSADPDLVGQLAERKITAITFDRVPRTLSRAQSMDALSSQGNVAGYKAAVLAADTYGGFFPMLMTAAGTTRPARVLVLGAGVAGLQAIATARRLGAMVTGYDIRAAARSDIASTGAAVLDLAGPAGDGAGGYARELSAGEAQAQRAALDAAVAGFDVVIATAQVPGRRPPTLVTAGALAAMRPGSVVVDLAAGPWGGNVEGSADGRTVESDSGVTVIGAGNLPSAMAAAASTAYARNVVALLGHLTRDGTVTVDLADEIDAAVVVTHEGVVHEGG